VEQEQRFEEVIDDVMIAFDLMGWKLVTHDEFPGRPKHRWPMAAPHGLTPEWCDSAEDQKG
jgi:hypothetical protein